MLLVSSDHMLAFHFTLLFSELLKESGCFFGCQGTHIFYQYSIVKRTDLLHDNVKKIPGRLGSISHGLKGLPCDLPPERKAWMLIWMCDGSRFTWNRSISIHKSQSVMLEDFMAIIIALKSIAKEDLLCSWPECKTKIQPNTVIYNPDHSLHTKVKMDIVQMFSNLWFYFVCHHRLLLRA